jgi:hypothetical protein
MATQPSTLPPLASSIGAAPPPAIVCYAPRERTRGIIRAAFPRRRARVLVARSPADFEATFRSTLVDAAVVDVGSAHEDTWRVAALAREFPSVPFFGLTGLRAAEGP